jgi:molecular chaperone GrpE (heat shock protein)
VANYTPYKLASGKVVNVPTHELERNMRLLKISRDEALELWLFDNEYIDNDEEKALTAKAKENRITATIHQAKAEYKQKTQRERVVKEDKVKESIVQAIADLLPSLDATEVNIEKKGKLITFKVGEDTFKVDLIRQRPPKENKG